MPDLGFTVDIGTFTVRQGDQFQLPILGELDADGALVNLASYGNVWTSQIRRQSVSDTFVPFTVDQTNIAGGVDSDPAAVQLLLSLTGVQTSTLLAGSYVFDVQVTGGALSPLTPYSGSLNVVQDVTRA